MKKDPSSATPKNLANELLARCQAALGESTDSEELLELVMQLLARELIAAKLQGQPICGNLKLLDRLMRYASLKLRLAAQRLRARKAEAKPAAPTSRAHEPAKPRATAADEAPPLLFTATKRSLEDKAYLESILERYGYLPKDRPDRQTSDFNINSKIIDFPYLEEEPVATKSGSSSR